MDGLTQSIDTQQTQSPTSTPPVSGDNPVNVTASMPQGPQESVSDLTPTQARPVGQPDVQGIASNRPNVSLAPKPQLAVPPQVQKAHQGAHIVRAISDVLSPPLVKTVYNPDGSSKQVRVPRSRGDIGMSIALAALTGAFAGLGERGPGHIGRAAQAGFQAGAQQRQNVQTSMDQQEQADYNRKLSTAEYNMRMYNLARQAGVQDKSFADSITDSYDTYREHLEDHSEDIKYGDLENGLSDDEVKNIMMKNPFKLVPIAVKTVPALDKDGQQVYLGWDNKPTTPDTPGARPAWGHTWVLADYNSMYYLSDENGPKQHTKDLVAQGPGNGSSPALLAGTGPSTPVPLALAANMTAKQVSINSLQKIYNDYADVLNEGKKEGDAGFIPPAKIGDLIGKNLHVRDINALAEAMGSSRGSDTESPLRVALAIVAKAHPEAARNLNRLFGDLGPYEQKYLARGAAIKKKGEIEAEEAAKGYDDRSAQRDLNSPDPKKRQAAQTWIDNKRLEEGKTAFTKGYNEKLGSEKAKKETEQVDDNTLIDAMASGQVAPEKWGYIIARMKDPEFMTNLVTRHPDIDTSKIAAYPKMVDDYTHGKTAQTIRNMNNAFTMLNTLKDLNTVPSRIKGTPSHSQYISAAHNASLDIANALMKPGISAREDDVKKQEDDLTQIGFREPAINQKIDDIIKQYDSIRNSWTEGAPSKTYEGRMPDVSPAAKRVIASRAPDIAQKYWIPQGKVPVYKGHGIVGFADPNGQNVTRW